MEITYNGIGQGSASNLITFTDIPNILKLKDDPSGTHCTISLMFTGNMSQLSPAVEATITLFGETVTGVRDVADAVNKNFWMSSNPGNVAASVGRALSNCPSIVALFTIEYGVHSDGTGEVELRARNKGKLLIGGSSQYISYTIPPQYMYYEAYDGDASALNGALVTVKVWTLDGSTRFITQLEKTFYNGECAFNMSPVLTTLAKIGRTVPYRFEVNYTKDGVYTTVGRVGNNHISVGYMVNQGAKYIPLSGVMVAQNYSRGDERPFSNNTILYLYGNTLPISFFRNGSESVIVGVTYRDSAGNSVGTTSFTYSDSDTNNKLKDMTLILSQSLLNSSFYVDVTIGGSTIRYNVIKPVKASEGYRRIYWRNSYGGISFFDFTGPKTETRDVTVETYQHNIFDYYEGWGKNSLDMVFDNVVKYNVTLKSHLFEKNGKYIFNDLMQTTEAWVDVNGESYMIIIDSVSVEETDSNNVYEATVRYHYSQEPSIL